MASPASFKVRVKGASLINGEFFTIEAQGSGSVDSGTVQLDWDIPSLPEGFSIYATVPCTSSATSQAFALEREGASNLMSLSGGNYRMYRFFDYGQYGSYDFDYEIRTSGETINSFGFSKGKLLLPNIIGAKMTLTEVMCPADRRKIHSHMDATLFAEDGIEIPISVSGFYMPLEDADDWTRKAIPQVRRSFVEEVNGERSLSLRYATVIEQIAEPKFPRSNAFAGAHKESNYQG